MGPLVLGWLNLGIKVPKKFSFWRKCPKTLWPGLNLLFGPPKGNWRGRNSLCHKFPRDFWGTQTFLLCAHKRNFVKHLVGRTQQQADWVSQLGPNWVCTVTSQFRAPLSFSHFAAQFCFGVTTPPGGFSREPQGANNVSVFRGPPWKTPGGQTSGFLSLSGTHWPLDSSWSPH